MIMSRQQNRRTAPVIQTGARKGTNMAAPTAFSKDFPLDAGIFTTAKVTIAGSTDANVVEAILANDEFPDGNIQLGHISLTADTGKVSLKPAAAAGATVSFDLSASAQSGM